MPLKTRLLALERHARRRLISPKVIIDVDSFEPGPDAPPGSPVPIVLRDRQGRTRVLGSLREFYDVTVRPEAR
jgi:hypothetical protein